MHPASSIPNTRDGVQINEASDVTVGGVNISLEESAGNVIANNGRYGVVIRAADEGIVTSGVLTGNTIVDNGQYGVLLENVSGVQIGADTFLAGNFIAGNGLDGVSIGSGSGNIVSANEIDNNAGLGIDLGPDGRTANDTASPPDSDTGANGLQNFPSVIVDADGSRISGTLLSTPNTDFEIELFVGSECDASGNGEGATFQASVERHNKPVRLRQLRVRANASIQEDEVVTATATGLQGTSEFSACAAPSDQETRSGRSTRRIPRRARSYSSRTRCSRRGEAAERSRLPAMGTSTPSGRTAPGRSSSPMPASTPRRRSEGLRGSSASSRTSTSAIRPRSSCSSISSGSSSPPPMIIQTSSGSTCSIRARDRRNTTWRSVSCRRP